MRWSLLLLTGCAYKVALRSTPAGVLVELPDGTRTTTPAVIKVRWAPFNEVNIRATARNHRPLQLNLRRTEVKFGRFISRGFRSDARGEVELILVPAHGPSGTWSSTDIP